MRNTLATALALLATAAVATSASTIGASSAITTGDPSTAHLTAAQVSQILAQAASQAKPGQAIAIVDREGVPLGMFNMTGASSTSITNAITRARTAAFFQSRGEAFTTRTARFIIQDNFPPGVKNTAGGPLYGVEFSSLPGSDALPNDGIGYVSGDPGGVPLYINGRPAGGIGVAGDGSNYAARPDLATPGQKVYTGKEEPDFDEAVALAGASGIKTPKQVKINAMAPAAIRADQVFVAGLRLPFAASTATGKNPFQTLSQLVTAGAGTIALAPIDSVAEPYPFIDATTYGLPGELKNTLNVAGGYAARASAATDGSNNPLPDSQKLTLDDVNTVIRQAVATSINVRAGIRHPIGASAVVHVAVIDKDGTVLGVFREEDGTNFSFDVAIQKGRTAAFFSDDTHAFTCTAIGFMSQRYFPPGQSTGATVGPLYHLQNALSTSANLGHGPLANGITIFPGGAPLYKNGLLVGAVGISGDGVNQDDEIAYGGTEGFRPANNIRCDYMSREQVSTYISTVVQDIYSKYTITDTGIQGDTFDVQAQNALKVVFTRLPYIKLARNPDR
jgi:uncharacterized protein GlcG (DUF336 family)